MIYVKTLLLAYLTMIVGVCAYEPPTRYTDENYLMLLAGIGWPVTAITVLVTSLFANPVKKEEVVKNKPGIRPAAAAVLAKPTSLPVLALPDVAPPSNKNEKKEIIKDFDIESFIIAETKKPRQDQKKEKSEFIDDLRNI